MLPVCTSTVPVLLNVKLLNVVVPVVMDLRNVPEFVKAYVPPEVVSTSSLWASHRPLLLITVPVPPWMVPPIYMTVPILFKIEPARARVVTFVRLRIAFVAMFKVEPIPRLPPVQFMVPVTVNALLGVRVPLEKLRPPTVVGVVTVIVAEFDRMAVSAAPGIVFGDQFVAAFQLPEVVFVQVIVA